MYISSAERAITTKTKFAYIFVVGADGLPLDRIDVLKGASGETDYQVQVSRGTSHQVKVVTDGYSGTAVDSLIQWTLEIRYLHM